MTATLIKNVFGIVVVFVFMIWKISLRKVKNYNFFLTKMSREFLMEYI
jgi:hypothetical protein